jgi:secreted PhoX family phosphatase
MNLLLALLGCVTDPAPPVATTASTLSSTPLPGPTRRHHLAVTPVAVPTGASQREVRAASSATLDGVSFPIGFHPLARTGDRIGGTVFGARSSRSGKPLELCEGLDYTGLWKASTGLTMVTHFECQPGAIYLTSVEALPDGRLDATATRAVDGRPIDGGNYFCAGAPTTWDSHLAAEEYEGDVRKLRPDGTLSDNFEDYDDLAGWWDGRLSEAHPWQYGWVVEVPPSGAPTRRWAMGRFSHELALPMPDERTVYLTDDTAEGGALFLFQADRPRDLSAGTLWAARWQPGPGDQDYALTWVSLGHATDAEVEHVVAQRLGFDDLFEVAAPTNGACPGGLTLARTNWGAECLRVRPGKEAPASRLEARRAAALAGATTELVKTEGLAFAPELRSVFLAMTRFEGPALASTPPDRAPDDLRLSPNRCGGVWQLVLGNGGPGGPSGPYVAATATLAVAGIEQDGACDADAIANPDNLAWIDGAGILAIAEDTGHHTNNALWFYDLESRSLTRVLTAPVGAEVSGLRWTAGVGRWSHLSVSIQHPFQDDPAAADAERRSVAGTLGPFPAWE